MSNDFLPPESRRSYLAELLGVAENLIFEDENQFTKFGVSRLYEKIALPKPFIFGREFRCPKPGENFLSLIDLWKSDEVIVCQSKDMQNVPDPVLLKKSRSTWDRFDFNICRKQDFNAWYKNKKVKVPFGADSLGRVVIVNGGKYEVVELSELRNFKTARKPTHLSYRNRCRMFPFT
jgi:hypothetical protein